jgi:hypothetical protein
MKKIFYPTVKYWMLIIGLFCSFNAFAQTADNWTLKKDKKGLKVYIRESKDSPFKELRLKFSIEASMSSIVHLLQDVEAIPNWVYKCPNAYVLKRVNENEEIYYNYMDFPWPLDDRDIIIRNVLTQDPETKVVRSESYSVVDFMEEKEKVVRIKSMHLWWTFTPKPNGIVDVEYYLKSDPGGLLPPWLVNLAIDQGPTQTIKRFRKILQEPKYKNARLDYISELHE